MYTDSSTILVTPKKTFKGLPYEGTGGWVVVGRGVVVGSPFIAVQSAKNPDRVVDESVLSRIHKLLEVDVTTPGLCVQALAISGCLLSGPSKI